MAAAPFAAQMALSDRRKAELDLLFKDMNDFVKGKRDDELSGKYSLIQVAWEISNDATFKR